MKIKRIDPVESLIAWLDQHQEVLREDFSKGELAYVCPKEDCSSRKKSGHVAFSVNFIIFRTDVDGFSRNFTNFLQDF